MSVRMVIELNGQADASLFLQAIESYKRRLRASIERTRRRLSEFEGWYGVDTFHFYWR